MAESRYLTKKMLTAVITGAILGVVCIIGASIRSGFEQEAGYLFAFWYNRLLLGIVIGAAAGTPTGYAALYRGAGFGLVVSFAFYASTGFADPIGFLVGPVYGVITAYAVSRTEAPPAAAA